MANLSSVGFSGGENEVDLEGLRARLRKMSDEELRRFGRASQYMCSPEANLGKPPRKPFVIQLEEARAEWKGRTFSFIRSGGL
jgi:hypothetical protein